MLFPNIGCLVRGGGDLATGVVYRLHRAGFPVVVLELDRPRVVRRAASVAQAMFSRAVTVGNLSAQRMTVPEALEAMGAAAESGSQPVVPVVADPAGESLHQFSPAVMVDARMVKSPLDTVCEQAALVIGLGPGFVAGQHCHAVVETNRGHDMGRVIWQGAAQPDTRRPEPVLGFDVDRVLRAPVGGVLSARREIGDLIASGDVVAAVNGRDIVAPFDGVLRGLLYDGLTVSAGEKVGDLDPRRQREACYTISDKSLAVGGGVVEAVLTWLDSTQSRKDAGAQGK